ncbi:MAG TPA: gliding motility-associated C-terminal domain-containing protein, partial [Crocinitomicaceae bacterium]|nr:gliding motility-associated C-terminal domain-containing protein [Crocinitomicaceae bacterium]
NGANGQQIGGCPHTAAMQGGAGANDGGGKGANGVKNNIQSMHKLNGNAGSPYGGGGSGAGIHLNSWANQWVLANGGAGANGAVIIEYTVSGSLPDKPSVIAGNNVLPCGGGTETYSVTNEAGITYTWTYSGTGTITGTGNTASLTATTGGTITVTPTGMCGDGPSETLNVTIETPPNNPISISGTSPIPCGSSTNTYTATAVAGVTYTWSYSGTGTITSGQGTNTITLDATSGGTLAVAISNVCGNGTQTTYTVAQQASPNNPSVISGNNNLPCNGGSGTYSVTNVSGITYTWSYSGTGTITSGQGTNSITLDATSGGTLTVTPSNACGNGTPQTISISLGTTPINLQPIQGNTLIPCGGASGTYSVINETGITYTWSYSGQGTITSGQGTSTITLDATTGGVLTVATANDCGNGPSETLTIMLDVANQTVDFNLPNNLCINGNTVTLAGTPAGGQFTMNGNTISEINPTALAVGSYTVKYTVNDNGCLLTADKTVQINGLPQLSSDLAPEYCHGTPSVAIHFQPNGGTATGDYLTGTTLNLTNATSGAHTVTYSYTDANGCSATMTQNYTVGTELNTTISYEESCMNVVTFAVSDENYQYNWNFYAFGTSTEKKPQVQFGSVGTHPIAVTITDSKNCSKVIQQDVIVSGTTVNTTLNIPNVITVNNDGVNDFFELDASLFDCLDLTITIVNRWGNPIFELDKDNLKFEGKTTKGKEITEGVYFYSVDSEKLGCKNGVGTNNCNGFITIIK